MNSGEDLARICKRALRRAGAGESDKALCTWVSRALCAHDAYLSRVCGGVYGSPQYSLQDYDPDEACEFVFDALAEQDGLNDEDEAAVTALLLRLDAFMEAVGEAMTSIA